MGIDRTGYIRQQCLCGKGEYVVNQTTDDHPYVRPDQFDWELLIECDDCSTKYEMINQDKQAVVVKKSDIKLRDQKQRKYSQRSEEFMESAEVKKHIRNFELFLGSRKTQAKMLDVAVEARIFRGVLGTFRKHLSERGLEKLVRQNVNLNNFPNVLKVLGVQDEKLEEKIKAIESLGDEADQPLDIIGEPLCTLTLKAFANKGK